MISTRRHRDQFGLSVHIVEPGTHSPTASGTSCSVIEVGKEISFDPSVLDTFHYRGWRPVHYDLLLVCAAVEYADRRRARRATRWSRKFCIEVPVLDLKAWESGDVRTRLCTTLRYLTGDDWQFIFRDSTDGSVDWSRQGMLPFPSDKEFVIAYSDGLDSRCVSGLFDRQDRAVRVRITNRPARTQEGERPFSQIPFAVRVRHAAEADVRSRGFKFAAVSAIAAHVLKLDKIVVPESGQDTIGPFLSPLHNSYPDYRNHPCFFRKMERLIEGLLGYSISYHQPRLWNTKGETVSMFLDQKIDGKSAVLNTRSCWQQRWNAKIDGKFMQCGLCAACLLRRVSMYTADVVEPVGTYVIEDLTQEAYKDAVPKGGRGRLSGTLVEYGVVGARHLQRLADMAGFPNRELRSYAYNLARCTSMSLQDASEALRRLLVRHASEWNAFRRAQGRQSFIQKWTTGARHA